MYNVVKQILWNEPLSMYKNTDRCLPYIFLISKTKKSLESNVKMINKIINYDN